MRRTFHGTMLTAILVAVTFTGCSRTDDDDDEGLPVARTKKGGQGGGGGVAASTLKPIKIEKTGTIEGVVKLEGSPNVGEMTAELRQTMSTSTNKDHCLSSKAPDADKSEFVWVFDANKNLQNVVIFVRPADSNEFFDVSELAKKAQEVPMDQPYCAFEPHVQIFWPKYIDPLNPSKDYNQALVTAQAFVMKNSAIMAHNTAWDSTMGGNTGGGNEIITPGSKLPIKNIRPSYRGPVKVACSIHPWMKGYVWAFDHPFAAKTLDGGKFKIEGVPAGVKLRLIAWHEGVGFLEGPNGREITVEAGKATKADFTAKAP